MKIVLFTNDILIFLLFFASLTSFIYALRSEYWKNIIRQVSSSKVAMISGSILCLYVTIGLLDSLHFRKQNSSIQSLLDMICYPLNESKGTEKTYSAPFTIYSYSKENIQNPNGSTYRGYPRLKYGGSSLSSKKEVPFDILLRILKALGISISFYLLFLIFFKIHNYRFSHRRKIFPYKNILFISFIFFLILSSIFLSQEYHILGTDKAGFDVFYISLKSIRTALIIGTLTTLIVTPFAIFFGALAGYLGGWIDDLVQYVYSTLASIPSILLIAAVMLITQVGLTEEETVKSAEKRLLYLCLIMGITSWTGLCRLIRGEVLKLREIEYVQAAKVLGTTKIGIMIKHLIPNVMHIVLITVVLRFSSLVLSEVVLAYVGIGIDPSMHSWGNLVNQARLELAREPIVWWNLTAAFIFMLGLVLPANIFGDALRDALDPKLKFTSE